MASGMGRSKLNGKHKSNYRCEYPVGGDAIEDEAEVSRHDDVTLFHEDRIAQSISMPNPQPLSVATLTPTSPLWNGPLADNSSRKVFTMGPERVELSLRDEDGAHENGAEGVRSHQDPTPPTSSSSHMITTYDPLEQINDQSLPLPASGDQYDAEKFQQRTPVDGYQRQRARRWKKEAKLPPIRSRNLRTRARTFERRSELREARIEMSIADEEFMKLVRAGYIGQSLGDNRRFQDEVVRAYNRLQNARNLYGPLEEAYDKLEERLDRQDFELKRLEEQILKPIPFPLEDEDDDYETVSSSSGDDGSEVSQMVEKMHPLYAQYMSRLGDEDLLREDYADLLFEYRRLQDQDTLRQGVQTSLHPDDQAILANFSAEEAKIREEMRVVGVDVERLFGECKAAGLLPEDTGDERPKSDGSHFEDQILNLLEQPNDLIDIGESSLEQSEYKRFPFLLEAPIERPVESPNLLDLSKSNILLSNFRENNPGDRITCWLLHKLRSSCSEVELLVRFSASMDGIGLDVNKDTDEWQNQVLHLWFVDSANLPPSMYEVDARSDDLEITGAVTITLMENEEHSQPRSHLASSFSSAIPTHISPSAIPLPPSSLPSNISPKPLSYSSTPSHLLSPPFLPLSSPPSTLEGVITIYSQPVLKYTERESRHGSRTDISLNPELAKYTIDNTTSQRLQIRAHISNYASFSLSEKTFPNPWSLERELGIKGLKTERAVEASTSGKYLQKSTTGRRAFSVGSWP